MNLTNFFAAVAMIAASMMDPFDFSDWLVACEWRELYEAFMAQQEVQ